MTMMTNGYNDNINGYNNGMVDKWPMGQFSWDNE